MEEEKKYPYLGVRDYKGKQYVILFTEENYGVVVMSEVDDNESLLFGRTGDFDETMFKYLPPEQCVRLSN